MAFQIGDIKVIGSIDGLNFYKSNGEYLVRTQTKIEKERIIKAPEFARTRENMSEFGAAAMMAKNFRQLFAPVTQIMGTVPLSGKATAMMKKINLGGDGQRGKRNFSLLRNKQFLEGFSFYSGNQDLIFPPPEKFLFVEKNKGSIHINLSSVQPHFDFKIAKVASHFQFVFHAGLLSDLYFDEEVNQYLFKYPDLNGLNAGVMTEYIPVSQELFDFGSRIDLPIASVPSHMAIIIGVGILFLEQVSGQIKILQEGRGFEVILVS